MHFFIKYKIDVESVWIVILFLVFKALNQFEIIINVSVSSFWFIWIPMLWVYGHYKYLYSYSAGIYFSRHNLTSTDVRLWRLK